MPFAGRQHAHVRQAKSRGALAPHDQEPLTAGTWHNAIEQPDRVGNQSRRQVLLERQLFLEHRVRITERVVALGDAQLAEVLARGTAGSHVIGGQEREAYVRAARSVREDGVACKYAKATEAEAERFHVVRVRTDARDHVGIAGLDRPQRAPEGDDATRTAERQMVKPARAYAEVLRQTDRGVRRQHEASQRQTIDVGLP